MKLLSSLLIAANAESACRGEIKDALEEWRQEMDAYKNTKNGLYREKVNAYVKQFCFQYGNKLLTTGI